MAIPQHLLYWCLPLDTTHISHDDYLRILVHTITVWFWLVDSTHVSHYPLHYHHHHLSLSLSLPSWKITFSFSFLSIFFLSIFFLFLQTPKILTVPYFKFTVYLQTLRKFQHTPEILSLSSKFQCKMGNREFQVFCFSLRLFASWKFKRKHFDWKKLWKTDEKKESAKLLMNYLFIFI